MIGRTEHVPEAATPSLSQKYEYIVQGVDCGDSFDIIISHILRIRVSLLAVAVYATDYRVRHNTEGPWLPAQPHFITSFHLS